MAFLTSCAEDRRRVPGPHLVNDASPSPAPVSVQPNQPVPGTEQDIPPTGVDSESIPTGTIRTTGEGGYLSVYRGPRIELTSGEWFEGAAMSGGDLLVLKAVNLSNGETRLRVMVTKAGSVGETAQWKQLCDLCQVGWKVPGFSADSRHFYLIGASVLDPTHYRYLRRFGVSDCIEDRVLDLGRELLSRSYHNLLYSFVSSNFYFADFGGYSDSIYSWDDSGLPLGSTNMPGIVEEGLLQYRTSIAVTSDAIWAHSYSKLWKHRLDGTALGWAQLPYAFKGFDLRKSLGVIAAGSGSILLIQSNNQAVDFLLVDVSHF